MIIIEILVCVIEWIYTVISFAFAWFTNKEYWHG